MVKIFEEALKIRKTKKYDLVLVDYGLVGNDIKKFKVLCEKEFVVYTGGLDSQYVINDVEKSPFKLPKLEFLMYGIEDLQWSLYNLFNKLR